MGTMVINDDEKENDETPSWGDTTVIKGDENEQESDWGSTVIVKRGDTKRFKSKGKFTLRYPRNSFVCMHIY